MYLLPIALTSLLFRMLRVESPQHICIVLLQAKTFSCCAGCSYSPFGHGTQGGKGIYAGLSVYDVCRVYLQGHAHGGGLVARDTAHLPSSAKVPFSPINHLKVVCYRSAKDLLIPLHVFPPARVCSITHNLCSRSLDSEDHSSPRLLH